MHMSGKQSTMQSLYDLSCYIQSVISDGQEQFSFKHSIKKIGLTVCHLLITRTGHFVYG